MPGPSEASFSDDQLRRARCFTALAHPARLAIVQLLAERDECLCGEIVDDLPLAQSTVSQHLKALKEAGLVRGTVDGRRTCYSLDPEALTAFKDDLDRFFGTLTCGSSSAECG